MTRQHGYGRWRSIFEWWRETVLGRQSDDEVDCGTQDFSPGPFPSAEDELKPGHVVPIQVPELPKNPMPAPDKPIEGLDPATIAFLDRELKAIGKLVRSDVNECLRGLEMGAGLAPARSAPLWRWLLHRRSDAFAGMLLIGLLFLGWQVGALRSEKAQGGQQALLPPASPVPASPVPASPSELSPKLVEPDRLPTAPSTDDVQGPLPIDLDQPLTSWTGYLRTNVERLPSWTLSFADYQGPGSKKMSKFQRGMLREMAEDTQQTIQLRAKGLLLVAFEVAVHSTAGPSLDGTVDRELKEYDAAVLLKVAATLGVDSSLTRPLTATSTRVRVAIAVAWLEYQKALEER